MDKKDQMLAKADQPGVEAMKLHPFYKGKIEVVPKACIRDFQDFAIWYTPGVAKPCLDINKNPETVYEHTNKANLIAVITDGTRVLGLGDIGPEASLPVMEGKAMLFKYLGGIDVFPIALDTKDPDKIIETVLLLQPAFGGVNLEDIAQPKCFRILDELRKKARIPIWHDDQQGTATVTVGGFINALRVVNKKINEVRVAMVGAGASNYRIAKLLIAAGVDPKHIIMCDSKGTLNHDRTEVQKEYKEKWEMCEITNEHQVKGGVPEAMKDADAVIALSTPGPGVIKKEWVKTMAKNAIVFACANPTPEIWPWEAKEAGARVVATGRSDFPNQVNNSLGFPGIFRGTLDVQAKTITDEMCIAAAYELAELAVDNGLTENHILPSMDDWQVFPREAAAVGMKAIEQGIAKQIHSKEELFKMAAEKIARARGLTRTMMDTGFIEIPHRYMMTGG
ncbi:MAG TPA: malate dehydrogenase [candidate division Zixibacteria bacterium]|nr:malate dehydrogenase [candidate division Zixibacteria bacterium]